MRRDRLGQHAGVLQVARGLGEMPGVRDTAATSRASKRRAAKTSPTQRIRFNVEIRFSRCWVRLSRCAGIHAVIVRPRAEIWWRNIGSCHNRTGPRYRRRRVGRPNEQLARPLDTQAVEVLHRRNIGDLGAIFRKGRPSKPASFGHGVQGPRVLKAACKPLKKKGHRAL